jgi:hypothetical protein
VTQVAAGESVTTFIYGSCVSRDTFEFLRSEGFTLARYVARQSAISASTDATRLASQLRPIESAFQERIVRGDLAGDLPAMLSAAPEELDVVLIDLVDERGGVIDIGGAYATKLSEFWSAGGREATRGMPHITFGSDAHFELWRDGMARVLAQLDDLGLRSRTVVLKTPWARCYDDGQPLPIPDWMMPPADADRLYERYFDYLAEAGLQVVELPAELARTPRDHQWGPSPFHYVKEAYDYLAEGIRATVGKHAPPVLSRRDTSPWGSFVDFAGTEALDVAERLPELLTVWHNGYPLDVMVDDIGSPTTLVSLHAALGSSGLVPPVFTGRAISDGIGVNRIFVSDPGLLAARDLGLAWYLGTEDLDLTELLVEVVRIIQKKMGARHLVFFGMSGGGFAALNLAHEFPGSLAVPVNPQTRVLDYAEVHWKAMARACFGATSAEAAREKLESHPRADQRRVYGDGFENWVIYVQNSADAHVSMQMLPWLEAVKWSERAPVLMQDWGSGHKPPGPAELRAMLGKVAGADGDWSALAAVWAAHPAPSREWVRSVSGR